MAKVQRTHPTGAGDGVGEEAVGETQRLRNHRASSHSRAKLRCEHVHDVHQKQHVMPAWTAEVSHLTFMDCKGSRLSSAFSMLCCFSRACIDRSQGAAAACQESGHARSLPAVEANRCLLQTFRQCVLACTAWQMARLC